MGLGIVVLICAAMGCYIAVSAILMAITNFSAYALGFNFQMTMLQSFCTCILISVISWLWVLGKAILEETKNEEDGN